jgi:hypothetical protein
MSRPKRLSKKQLKKRARELLLDRSSAAFYLSAEELEMSEEERAELCNVMEVEQDRIRKLFGVKP